MWEKIPSNTTKVDSDRLRVPGGWIVRSYSFAEGGSLGSGACHVFISKTFVTDPSHEWKLEC